ncbi:protein TALPID3-like isoform X2 [Coregonus clupeaformis]|uniref:protein TALPID3-like isoform X2 n=1 Tax=Coregonus clupeaformis TaxID=59861 RepID=UPI001BDFC537|nr:protein TALPID3-like isoform X2 [Coregonus clupeaformis]
MSQEAVAMVLPPTRLTPTLLQPCHSFFEDAERVLRQVQRHKKTLEENLEAMLRARDGETLHSQLEDLSCNSQLLTSQQRRDLSFSRFRI